MSINSFHATSNVAAGYVLVLLLSSFNSVQIIVIQGIRKEKSLICIYYSIIIPVNGVWIRNLVSNISRILFGNLFLTFWGLFHVCTPLVFCLKKLTLNVILIKGLIQSVCKWTFSTVWNSPCTKVTFKTAQEYCHIERKCRGGNHPPTAFNREIIKHWICLVRWGLKKWKSTSWRFQATRLWEKPPCRLWENPCDKDRVSSFIDLKKTGRLELELAICLFTICPVA